MDACNALTAPSEGVRREHVNGVGVAQSHGLHTNALAFLAIIATGVRTSRCARVRPSQDPQRIQKLMHLAVTSAVVTSDPVERHPQRQRTRLLRQPSGKGIPPLLGHTGASWRTNKSSNRRPGSATAQR
jgi:hypothetical protein